MARELKVVSVSCNLLLLCQAQIQIQVLNKSYAFSLQLSPVNMYVHRANMHSIHAFFIFTRKICKSSQSSKVMATVLVC